MNMPPPDVLAFARRALIEVFRTGGDAGFESLQALADAWLATQSGTMWRKLSRGDPQLRADMEDILRNYFLQGVLITVKAIKDDSEVCEVLWRASECSARNLPPI